MICVPPNKIFISMQVPNIFGKVNSTHGKGHQKKKKKERKRTIITMIKKHNEAAKESIKNRESRR